MKFEIRRHGIVIIPEDDQDVAYIEDTLGLKHAGTYTDLTRVNQMDLSSIAYLETGCQKTADPEIMEAARRQLFGND
jgi:hypothetical protein